MRFEKVRFEEVRGDTMSAEQLADAGSDIVLDRLMSLHPKIIDLTLDRVYRLLDAVGNPHLSLPPVIHVAGTNGKGSVIAYLRAALEAAGLGVHAYTSPHLVRFHERIRLAAKQADHSDFISETDLRALLEECEAANGSIPITFFEITTVAAFLAFSRTAADAVLLEVGLGGRLDATNVIDRPALSIITPVSLDHQQYLGDTIDLIAGEKAGIIKPNVPVICGPQDPRAKASIKAKAAEVAAPLLLHGRDWSIERTGSRIRYVDDDGSIGLPLPGLPGHHQIENAGIAVAALKQLRTHFAIPDRAITQGVQTATWPARMQKLVRGPLVNMLPDGWELYLDGGHNPAAGEALAKTLGSLPPLPLHVVFAMLNTKDPNGFLRPIVRHAESVTASFIPDAPATLSSDQAFEAARTACGEEDVDCPISTADSIASAVGDIVAAAKPRSRGRIVLCGSLYLAGFILAENG